MRVFWPHWSLIRRRFPREHWLPELFEKQLKVIERDIHKRKNETKYCMNGTLIAIGVRNAKLEKLALKAAERIGKVEVDHGDTACKTPDAATYIKKTVARKRK